MFYSICVHYICRDRKSWRPWRSCLCIFFWFFTHLLCVFFTNLFVHLCMSLCNLFANFVCQLFRIKVLSVHLKKTFSNLVCTACPKKWPVFCEDVHVQHVEGFHVKCLLLIIGYYESRLLMLTHEGPSCGRMRRAFKCQCLLFCEHASSADT